MSIYRYSEWDGTQDLFDLNADELAQGADVRHLAFPEASVHFTKELFNLRR